MERGPKGKKPTGWIDGERFLQGVYWQEEKTLDTPVRGPKRIQKRINQLREQLISLEQYQARRRKIDEANKPNPNSQ